MEKKHAFAAATIFLFIILKGVAAITLTIKNDCTYNLWVNLNSNGGKPLLPIPISHFMVTPKESQSVVPPENWSGDILARTNCTGSPTRSGYTCISSVPFTSNPSATTVRFFLNSGGQDRYLVSLLAGFNVPVAVIPNRSECKVASCSTNLNAICPPELSAVIADQGAPVVGCISACAKFNDETNCCLPPSNCQNTKYTDFFSRACPTALSYGKLGNQTFTCAAGSDYVINFCPFFV